MCRGWAVGSLGWRRAIARQQRHLALALGYEHAELREIKEARWQNELEQLLGASETAPDAIVPSGRLTARKLELAVELRRRTGAPYRWIAAALNVAQPESLRMQIHRQLLQVSP